MFVVVNLFYLDFLPSVRISVASSLKGRSLRFITHYILDERVPMNEAKAREKDECLFTDPVPVRTLDLSGPKICLS